MRAGAVSKVEVVNTKGKKFGEKDACRKSGKENVQCLHPSKMEATTGSSKSISEARGSMSVSRVNKCHCSNCIHCNKEAKSTGSLSKHVQWDHEEKRWSFMLDACFKCKGCRAAQYKEQDKALKRARDEVESLPTEINDPVEIEEQEDKLIVEETTSKTAVEETILPRDATKNNNPAETAKEIKGATRNLHAAAEEITIVNTILPSNPATEDEIEEFQVQEPEETATLTGGVTVVKIIPKGIIIIVKTINKNQNPILRVYLWARESRMNFKWSVLLFIGKGFKSSFASHKQN
jgi:hypothetical protein